MNADQVIRLERVSKSFKLYGSASDRLADWLRLPPRPRHREFCALRDISFNVRRGECVGIIGPNGAGKSTLLKLLTGVLHHTSGSIEVQGRVLSLLELGTGFAPDLTGRQNVEHSARMLGFPRGHTMARLDEIRAFADIGEFFDRPVKFYSSGMLVRLAFALFSTMQPEVFLVDEALAVGDLRFAAKALARIRAMIEQGTTLLFVSHDLQLINQLCSRAIWLHAGSLQMDGAPSDVTRAYQQFVVHGSAQQPQPEHSSKAVGAYPALALGAGWYPLEAYGGEVFRWGSPSAELILDSASGLTAELLLDLEAAPAADQEQAALKIVDEADRVLALLEITERSIVRVAVTMNPDHPTRVYLRSEDRVRALGDDRELSVRVFNWGWDDEATMAPIGQASDWVDAAHDLELSAELTSMRRALRRCKPLPDAEARIIRVCTRSSDGAETVRFGTHDPCVLEVTLEALRDLDEPVLGVQVRDAFDRLLWTTRTDWEGSPLPRMVAGQRVTARLLTDRLLLGRGVYQITVAVHRYPDEHRVIHWVDGAWRFEVIDSPGVAFKGMFDLGWRYEPVSVQGHRGTPALSR